MGREMSFISATATQVQNNYGPAGPAGFRKHFDPVKANLFSYKCLNVHSSGARGFSTAH